MWKDLTSPHCQKMFCARISLTSHLRSHKHSTFYHYKDVRWSLLITTDEDDRLGLKIPDKNPHFFPYGAPPFPRVVGMEF